MSSLNSDLLVSILATADTTGITQTEVALAKLQAQEDEAAESATNFSSGMKTAALVAGAAIVAGAAVSVKAAADYQSALTRLVTSAGETTDNLSTVSAGILQVAKDTGTATTDLTSAMYTIESAGQHGADGLLVLKAAAEGAKEENADVGQVADAVSSALVDYHLKASDAAQVTSTFITAISYGKTNFQDFASSLSSVLPIASASGVSLDNVTAAIASMTVHGMSAQQATDDLSHTIQKMQSPTQQMTGYLAQLGITSSDLATDLGSKGITGTLQTISDAILKQMGPSGQVLVNALNQSKIAAQDANTMIASMPTNLQNLAKGYADGSITLNQYRQDLKALPSDQVALMQQFVAIQNSADGFNSTLKAGGNDAKTYEAALYAATGDTTTLNTALMLTGENSDYVNNAVKGVSDATVEAGGNVKGWSDIQGNFNLKLQQFEQWVNTSAISLGMVLIPVATKAIDLFLQFNTTVGNFINNNLRPLQVGFTALGAAIATFAVGSLVSGLYAFITAGGIATTVTKGLAIAFGLLDAVDPVVLALTALAFVGTAVISSMQGSTQASTALSAALARQKEVQQELTSAEQAAKTAEDNLAHAKVDQQAASLAVEQAQVNLTDAINEYGKDSLQAREAANQLAQAQLQLGDATSTLTADTNTYNDAENKASGLKQQAIAVNKQVADAANNAANGYANFANQVTQANKAMSSGNAAAALSIMTSIPGQKTTTLLHNATGTNSSIGGMTIVGENGPELVNMPRGAQVFTNHESKKMAGGNTTENHFYGNIVLGSASAVQEMFKQLDQDGLNSSMGLSVSSGATA